MTDNEIIMALECCINHRCRECPARAMFCSESVPMAFALDLITRQKAEVERLNEKLKTMQAYIEQNKLEWSAVSFIEYYRKLKAEAIKEFAERLKEKGYCTEFGTPVVDVEDIYNLVKEMVGDV